MKAEKINKEEIIQKYKELKSSYKVAKSLNITRHKVVKVLKENNELRDMKQAALERDNSQSGKYVRTDVQKTILSNFAKQRKGSKNSFFGKAHSEETKKILSEKSKSRIGKLNPNYKNGKYLRRPRDFKVHEFTKIRNFVFNRDKYTCVLTREKGIHLHAHHLLPYWVCAEAFLDTDNIITVSTKAHFDLCHNGSWGSFNVDIIPDYLLNKYSLSRERLNELASIWKKR